LRNGLENAFHGEADAASRATSDRSLLMGDVLGDGRRAFVNCTRATLVKGLVTLLPSTMTVVEILESVPADPEVLSAGRSLKEAGYMIALDDHVADDRCETLAHLADIHAPKAVLLVQPSSARPVFHLMLAHQSGEWDAAAALSPNLSQDPESVAAHFWRAPAVGARAHSCTARRSDRSRCAGCGAVGMERERNFGPMPSCAKRTFAGSCAFERGLVP